MSDLNREADGWETASLESCLDALIDYRGKSPTKSPSGIPVLSAKVVKTAGLLRPIEQTIAPDYYPKWMTRGFPRPGDVVMTTEAPMGEVIQLNAETAKFALGQRIVCLRGKAGKLDNTFLRYLLTSPKQQEILASYATGTTVLGISQKALRSIPISFPDFEEQQEIGELLAALDDKIELNRRMNETLEGMAQAIFRDWFVDFGPVRRAQAGETDPVAIMGGLIPSPVLAAQIAANFPAAFGNDGLPVGWSLRTVESILELAYGKALPKTVRKDGPFPVYGSGGISGTHSTALVSGPGIIVGRKGTVGSLYWETGDFFAIDTVFYVVPKDSVPLNVAWHLLQTLGLEGMNTDAAVPGLNRGNAYRLEFAFGGTPLFDAFEAFAAPLRARQDASNSEMQSLVESRDYLLPRLMSGAVRVAPKAEIA